MVKKRKNDGKKPRSEYIYASTQGKVDSLTISYDPVTDAMSFGQPMVNVYSEASYARIKSDKVLNRVYQQDDSVRFGCDAPISNFDTIITIDTNQKNISTLWISATTVILQKYRYMEKSSKIYEYETFVILRTGKEQMLERQAWYYALRCLVREGIIDINNKIALVIDSHLGELNTINERTAPIWLDIPLPTNLSVHYASADKATESTTNYFMKKADEIASMNLSNFIKKVPLIIPKSPTQEHVFFAQRERWTQIPLSFLYSHPAWK